MKTSKCMFPKGEQDLQQVPISISICRSVCRKQMREKSLINRKCQSLFLICIQQHHVSDFKTKLFFAGFLPQHAKHITTVWNAASASLKCWLWFILTGLQLQRRDATLEDLFAAIIVLPVLIVCQYRTFSAFSEG